MPLLRPLEELTTWITTVQNTLDKDKLVPVIAFLLAPLTGFSNMFKIDDGTVLKTHLTKVYGQLFAWDNAILYNAKTQNAIPGTFTYSPQSKNILKNQFNVDCDTVAVDHILKELNECRNLTDVQWIPTEMIKNETLDAYIKTLYDINYKKYSSELPLVKLWRQWSFIKGSPQFIFDPSVIFHAHEHSTQMVKTIKEIKYTIQPKEHYTAVVFTGEVKVWDRAVYQITPDYSKITHKAVFAMDDQIHIKKLDNLLTYNPQQKSISFSVV